MVARGFVGLDPPASRALQMLADPCNATLEPGCYRGDQGFKARFVSNGTLLSAGTTVNGAIAFAPCANLFYTIDWTSTPVATAWTNNSVNYSPGRAFLTANAASTRSLGACLSVTPLATNLATSGVVYSGIVPASLVGGGTYLPSDVAQLCNNFGKITIDQPMECKFIPGSADEEYSNTSILSDSSDCMLIVFVFLGFPGGTGFSCRATNIVEWKPLTGLGLTTSSAAGNPSKNTIEHVKQALRSKDDSWYTNVGKTAFSVIRGYATGGVAGMVGAAVKAFK